MLWNGEAASGAGTVALMSSASQWCLHCLVGTMQVGPEPPSSEALTGDATQALGSFCGLKAVLVRGATLGACDRLTT